MSAPPPGLVVEYGLADPENDSLVMFSEPVVWLESRAASADDVPFVAWVVHDGTPMPADSLQGFIGYGWRPPIVAALPGRGWRVKRGRTSRDIEVWLVRGDGALAAAVVDGPLTTVVDPLEDEVTFVAPGGVR